MKTYKKPISILIEVDAEELMAISSGQILDKGTEEQYKDLSGSGVTTGDGGITDADAKGFNSWE